MGGAPRTVETDLEAVSSSAAMLRLADSILSLERRDVSRVVAAYMLFKSQGRSNRDLVLFLMTSDLRTTFGVGLKILPSMLAGLISDSDFRTLVLSSLAAALRKTR